jgi:hypothetical protein
MLLSLKIFYKKHCFYSCENSGVYPSAYSPTKKIHKHLLNFCKWERDGNQQKQKRGHSKHLFYISGNSVNVSNSGDWCDIKNLIFST